MTQPVYPPPPPPSPTVFREGGLHGPRTNLFLGIRMRLVTLEQQLLSGRSIGIIGGFLVAFVVSAVLGLLISLVVQLALLPVVGMDALMVAIAPLTEEPSKALGMLIVAVFMWKIIPNRRYGAALGAAAGLGFGVAESILYIYSIAASNLPAELSIVRIVITPLMHPLWSAFVGLGVFVCIAKRSNRGSTESSSLGLALLFMLTGMANHLVWNSVALLSLYGIGYWSIALDAILVFPVFALVLRDFLGGHFNFQNFFTALPEPSSPYLQASPPPPPLPPP